MNTTNQTFEGKDRCPYCGIFFISQSQVDRHIAKRHGPVIKPDGSYLLSKDGKTAYTISIQA